MQVINDNYGQDKLFDWDGLSLINRSYQPTTESSATAYSNTYINEPAVTGGNPILSNDTVMFNDMLGSTYATSSNGNITAIERTQFGVTDTKTEEFFTGKPHIKDMGYAFLFRNYRSELSKWQSADPIGYPDGLNNFAYVNNGVTDAIDLLGAWKFEITGFANNNSSFTYGSKSKIPNIVGGGYKYFDYMETQGSVSASGDNTSQLTLACSASFLYRDTEKNINTSINISYSMIYDVDDVDDEGNVSQKINGVTTKSTGEIATGKTSITMTGGANSTFSGVGNYNKKIEDMVHNFSGSILTFSGTNYKVVE